MKKIIIISIFLVSVLYIPLNASEACGKFNLICKAKQSYQNTKEYQKKEWDKASKPTKLLKKAGETIKGKK